MLLFNLFRFELFILKGAHGSILPSKNSKCQTLPVSMTMFYRVKMFTFVPLSMHKEVRYCLHFAVQMAISFCLPGLATNCLIQL